MKRFLPLFFAYFAKKIAEKFASSEKSRTFASLSKNKAFLKEVWKGGRVVDYSGLENRRAERHRGFESLPFRGKNKRWSNF